MHTAGCRQLILNWDLNCPNSAVPEITRKTWITPAYTVKPVLSGHSKRRPKFVFKTNYPLMQVKSIAEFSKGSILQYFRPSLSYHLSLRSLFCRFLSGRLRQVLLYDNGTYYMVNYPTSDRPCQRNSLAPQRY